MLKIKNNVDLKELEKYRLIKQNNLSSNDKLCLIFDVSEKGYGYSYLDIMMYIDLKSREIKFDTSAYGANEFDLYFFSNILFDLIQTGLIEKVGETKTSNNIKDLIIDKLEVPISKFCEELGLSRWTIDNILKGYGQKPSLLTIKKICKYFNVDFKSYV